MVIQLLQTTHPPVVMNFQETPKFSHTRAPSNQPPESSTFTNFSYPPLPQPAAVINPNEFASENKSSVGGLLAQFFSFYSSTGQFKWANDCLSIRLGKMIPISSKACKLTRSSCCIEDPLDPLNNVAASIRPEMIRHILSELDRANILVSVMLCKCFGCEVDSLISRFFLFCLVDLLPGGA